MAGRIKDEDVTHIRDHSPIDEVVGDYVQLKNAGGGQKKGLCPFHDEKSPSFHVTPSKGYFHCFGCQVGGDVIAEAPSETDCRSCARGRCGVWAGAQPTGA